MWGKGGVPMDTMTATAATELTPFVGTSMARTRTWATLPADELRR